MDDNHDNTKESAPIHPKRQSIKATWLLVIGVLSVVILTFVAAAALYIMVGGIIYGDSGTVTGDIQFSENSPESGIYSGGFLQVSKKIELKDVSLVITDDSLDESGSLRPLVDGGTVVISGGIRCTFSDINHNGELDIEDIFRIENGSPGDYMIFEYLPTENIFAHYTLYN